MPASPTRYRTALPRKARSGICQPERGTGWRILLSFGLRGIGRVDPGVRGDFRWLGRLADESLGVCLESGGQDGSALFADGRGVSVVNVGGGVQAEAAVPVVVVVPGEELLAVGSACGPPRVFRTAELSLFHAASRRFRYSSRASCGVRYPSPE